jgi:hypothetical protein
MFVFTGRAAGRLRLRHRRRQPTRRARLGYVTPQTGSLAGFGEADSTAVLGERFGRRRVLAATLVACGIVLLNLS